jgi:CheY-like chemotaxis protein
MNALKDRQLATHDEARANSVLIVDDENVVRDLMARWLESGGFTVSTAASAEALGRFEPLPPAVALCDIRMPGHDGIWRRTNQAAVPETAVIMATGVQDVGPAVTTLRQGSSTISPSRSARIDCAKR